jgi:hypothetical protein
VEGPKESRGSGGFVQRAAQALPRRAVQKIMRSDLEGCSARLAS